MNVSKEIKKDVEMTITDQQPFQQYKLDILLSVSSFQNQNGIRLNDYYRYSRFCGKKINKLRKLLKITQGKRKYGKIMIDNEVAQKAKDSR
jgi:signal recognition particle subunit SRP68